ncbi:DUF262 domain-containing protein [Anaerorhabdus sp.]|uniref:DUF262 domain-containing protein n=1 Tax=Anaerorhabdus sp. TaxID=1872524 RepID=UPI002FCC3E24
MIGTICTVREFLNNEEFLIRARVEGTLREIYRFSSNRIIEIPKYQREIRWDVQNVNQLLSDILKKDKFLGNVYLSEDIRKFEVIDGQQRLTVIYILLTILAAKYSEISNEFESFSLINLNNPTFINFFDKDLFDETEDPFKQKERFVEIHNCINSFLEHLEEQKIHDFCSNILESRFNLILLTDEEKNDAIDSFVDINVKGVKLDSEDIFKGYFFKKNGNNQSAKTKWISLKTEFFELFDKDNSIKLVDLLYNVLFCIVRNASELESIKNVNFDKDFLLSEDVSLQNGSNFREYEKGTHIMELIPRAATIDRIIDNTISLIILNRKFITNDISKDSPYFLDVFKLNGIDPSRRDVYFSMVKFLFRNCVSIYKFLITYCFVCGVNDYLENGEKNINYSYFYSFMFDSLSTRKGLNSVVKNIGSISEFKENLLVLTSSLLQNDLEPKLNFTQKFCMEEQLENITARNIKFTVLQFAIMFECFKFSDDKTELNFNSENFMHILSLSNEHFIINDCKKYVENGTDKKYTSEQVRKTNMFINLIPINEQINNDLGNKCLSDKIAYLRTLERSNSDFWVEEGCEYSFEYLNSLEELFNDSNNSFDEFFDKINLLQEAMYKKFKDKINF